MVDFDSSFTRRVCFFCLQLLRTNNPNMSSEIIIVNVELPVGTNFDETKALEGAYTFQILGGQHINICDWELLGTVYHGKASNNIPQNVFWKTVEIYLNLTADERSIFILAANAKLLLEHSTFEKVRDLHLISHIMDMLYKLKNVLCFDVAMCVSGN